MKAVRRNLVLLSPRKPLVSDLADTIVPSRRLRSNETAHIVRFISYTTL